MRFRELRTAFLGVLVVLGTFLSVTLPTGAQTAPDPLTAARFSISIDGVEVASFGELVGIRSGSDDILDGIIEEGLDHLLESRATGA